MQAEGLEEEEAGGEVVITWLWDVLIGQLCWHRWAVIHKVNLYDGERSSLPHGSKYVLQCSKCGNIKSKRT